MKRIPKISLILSVFLITLITDCEKDIVQEESLPEEEIVEAIWLNKEDLTKILVGKSEKRIWIPP